MTSRSECIIALDLGTTAFKCAAVNENGLLSDTVTEAYDLDYDAGLVTLDPETYVQVASRALVAAAQGAHRAGLSVRGIGISSQAQTYIPLDYSGKPLQKAVVWTDDRAVDEADELTSVIPDFAQHSGFAHPLPALFLPKIKHFQRHSGIALDRVWKFALLNEYIIYRLTGSVYGDETNQGMSGFYHIRSRRWSETALNYAGIAPHQLAKAAAGAHIGMPLSKGWRELLNLDAVPVYSCGNDQSCSAAGAGLRESGDILCNFGTAMTVYALRDELPAQLQAKQISGISPITGRYFLLALENECGNVLDWAHRLCYADQSFSAMLVDALSAPHTSVSLPRVALPGGGRIQLNGLTVGSDRRHVMRALLEYFAATFGELLSSVREGNSPGRLFAAGGLSRSSGWLDFISQRYGLRFERTVTEQPGLVGVARIIKQANAGG